MSCGMKTSATPPIATDLGGELQRGIVRPVHIRTGNLHVDRRRQAEVQHGVHQPAGLEISAQLGHVGFDSLLHARHVFVAAGLVIFLQADLHEGGVHGRIGSVNGREIRSRADVGNDHAEILGRYDFSHQVLNLGHLVLGHGEARPVGRLQIDDELPGVRARKEGETEQGNHRQASGEGYGESGQRHHGPAQHHRDQAVVESEKTFEPVVEPDVEPFAQGSTG